MSSISSSIWNFTKTTICLGIGGFVLYKIYEAHEQKVIDAAQKAIPKALEKENGDLKRSLEILVLGQQITSRQLNLLSMQLETHGSKEANEQIAKQNALIRKLQDQGQKHHDLIKRLGDKLRELSGELTLRNARIEELQEQLGQIPEEEEEALQTNFFEDR